MERKGDEGPGGNLNPFMDIATPYISRLRACIVNVASPGKAIYRPEMSAARLGSIIAERNFSSSRPWSSSS